MMKLITTFAAMAAVATAGGLAQAEEAAGPTHPESGKSCVAYFSAERTDTGRVRMHFRNICNQPFQIRIPVGEKARKGSIEAGTPDKPAKAYVTCRSDDGCETADWTFE
jgi:hypothetical protein